MFRWAGATGVAAAVLAALIPVTGVVGETSSQAERTPDHPCAGAPDKECYGVVSVTTVPTETASPMTAGARHFVARRAQYQEHGYDFPGDVLYTVSLEADMWWDGSSAGVTRQRPQCDAEGGVKQWSCTSTKSGNDWEPGRYGGVAEAWGDFVTEWHYPCPWCSEVNQSFIRLWQSPSGDFHFYAGR